MGLVSCKNDLSEVRRIFTADEVKVETMKDVEMLYSDSAIVRVKVKGPTLLRHRDPDDPFDEFPDGLAVDFFDNYGIQQSKLTANYAIRRENENQIIVRDSVVWQSNKREVLETEELIWDEKKQIVYTKRFVTITKPEEIIFGYGFEADQDFSSWEINSITGRIMVNSPDEEVQN